MTPNQTAFSHAVLILESLLLTIVPESESGQQMIKVLHELNIVTVLESILKRSIQQRLVSAVTSASKSLVKITPFFVETINQSKIPKLLILLTHVIKDFKACYVALSVIAEFIKCASDSSSVVLALGGPLALLRIPQIHQNSELHIAAMKCIAQGGANHQLAEQFASAELLKEFMDALCITNSNSDTLAATINVLHSLIKASSEVQRKCIEQGLVEKLLQLLKPRDALTESCVSLLWTLCDSKGGKIKDSLKQNSSAMSALLSITHNDVHTQLQQTSFEILWYTTNDSIPEQRALAKILKANCLIALAEIAPPTLALTATTDTSSIQHAR